jgi:hypothetical protein
LKKLMLLAAMLAMVLAVAAPAMAQQNATATQAANQQVTGGGNIAADISYSECVAIVAQGGNVNAVQQQILASGTTSQTNVAVAVQDNEAAADIAQYCVDIIDSFNTVAVDDDDDAAAATTSAAAASSSAAAASGGGGGGGGTLPATGGGFSLLALGAGALLIGGGLVARRIIR